MKSITFRTIRWTIIDLLKSNVAAPRVAMQLILRPVAKDSVHLFMKRSAARTVQHFFRRLKIMKTHRDCSEKQQWTISQVGVVLNASGEREREREREIERERERERERESEGERKREKERVREREWERERERERGRERGRERVRDREIEIEIERERVRVTVRVRVRKIEMEREIEVERDRDREREKRERERKMEIERKRNRESLRVQNLTTIARDVTHWTTTTTMVVPLFVQSS